MKLEVGVQVSSYFKKIFQEFSSSTRKVFETSSIFVPSNFEFVALTSAHDPKRSCGCLYRRTFPVKLRVLIYIPISVWNNSVKEENFQLLTSMNSFYWLYRVNSKVERKFIIWTSLFLAGNCCFAVGKRSCFDIFLIWHLFLLILVIKKPRTPRQI